MNATEAKQMEAVLKDPPKWANVFVKTFNPLSKRVEPWNARWYQVDMLRDKSLRIVARCGRRIGVNNA